MSVPSQKKQKEDGQQGAVPGSFYYYSPHSAAPGSERAWQETYHQMARRVTGGPSSWDQQYQQQQQPPHPNSNYVQQQQQHYQYSMFHPPNGNNAPANSDPWNWGWDESSNTESGNNNTPQHDPTWDWSVEGSNTYQQQHPQQHQQQQHPQQHPQQHQQQQHPQQHQQQQPPPPAVSNSPMNYHPDAAQQQQSWSSPAPVYGNEGHQHNYSNVPHNIVDDSFTTPAVSNQNSFNQQPVGFQTVNKSGQNFSSFGTGGNQGLQHVINNNNSIAEQSIQQQVPVSNENANVIDTEQSQNYNSGYFSGFPLGSNDVVGYHQTQAVEYGHQGNDKFPREEIKTEPPSTDVSPDGRLGMNVGSGTPSIPETVGGTQFNIKQDEDSYDLQTSSASEDIKYEASTPGSEMHVLQRSNESLASRVTEEHVETGDQAKISEAGGEKTNISHETSYPQSYQYNFNTNQFPENSGQNASVNVWEQGSTHSYTEPEVETVKQELLSSPASSDHQNSSFQSSSASSVGLIGTANENKSFSEHLGAPVGALAQLPVDNVMKNLESLSLDDAATNSSSSHDVENIEIVPPENNNPLGKQTLPPSPIATLATGSSSNPYAARNPSLNHKYANKNRIVPQTGKSESGERMNYAMNLTQSESDHNKKLNTHFVSSNELYPSGSFSARNTVAMVPTAEEAVNLETVPDNKERPDFIDMQHSLQMDRKSVSPLGGTRPHATLTQDSVRGPTVAWGQQAQQPLYGMTPENQEIAPRCGPERNQYLETGQLPDDDLEVCGHLPDVGDNIQYRPQPFLPPPGLHRMVPGQQTEQENVSRTSQPEIGIHEDISTPPPGLHRMVPGQFTESETSGILDMTNSSHQDNSDDLIIHRMVPGRLKEDLSAGNTVQNDANSMNVTVGSALDEIPPPGLRRMVPGESSSPESQGNSSTPLVSGSTMPGGTFQPVSSVPMEPRVVTGVAQDEIDTSGNPGSSNQTSSPAQLSSSGQVTSEPNSPSPEESPTTSTLPQPTSERSETIGSDRVETYPPPPSDSAARELNVRRDPVNKERDRRHRDDQEGDERSRRRQTNGREYYGSREREDSPNGGRYRGEDRERRSYDRERNHDREDSPSSGRYRYDTRQEYRHRNYNDEHRTRHRRGYEGSDEDADNEEYFNERERDRNLDRERDRGHERDRREGGYRDDYSQHYRGHTQRERNQREGHDQGSRDRPDPRATGRHDRDDRDRDGYRDRRRYNYPDHDYRRVDNYYNRGYEQDGYYRSAQRPNSRSGRPEYEDDRRRNYHAYSGQDYYEHNYLLYQYYWQHQQLKWQQIQQQPGFNPEDRGSVHSGRSSANEELHRDRTQNHVQDNNSMTVDGITSLPQRMTPAKFTTAHIKGVMSSHGHLLKTPAHYPLDGQPAVVELFDVQNIFKDDEIYNELRDFPGPLIKSQTHKNSVIGFCLRKIQKAEHDPNLFDRDSVILFWRLLILLLKQNGTVVGSDIAELLLTSQSESSTFQQPAPSPSPAVSQGSINEISHDVHQARSRSEEEVTTRYREHLLYGNTKDALEWAMKHGLWGHALFLASKMDQRTYANVMMRFANGLTMNDPLQTLYQLMSGRPPAAVTCCADERWGDWKPHLAMIVANSNQWEDLHRQAITTLGDTLAARGCFHAAHFCYVMAQLDFGTYSQKSSKLVLLGSSHLQPFSKFASNEAIQITEVYLYTIQLANPDFEAPHFQLYKLLYAQRLAEYGLVQEALQYAEAIARAAVKQAAYYDLNFLQRLYDLGNQLKYHDPVFSAGGEDANWLQRLATTIKEYMTGAIHQEGPSYGSTSNLSYSEGDLLQAQYSGLDYTQNNQESHYYDNSWQQQQPQQHFQDMQPWQQQQQPGATGRTEGYSQELEGASEQVQASYISHPEQVPDISTQDSQQSVPPAHHSQHLQGGDEFHSGAGGEGLVVSNGQSDNSAFDYWNVSANKQQEGGPKLSPSGTVPLDEPGGPPSLSQHPPPSSEDKQPSKPKPKKQSPKAATKKSWFGVMWSKLLPDNQMILPDDKNPSIVWDSDRNRWINVDSDEDETTAALPPPPKMIPQLPSASVPTPGVSSAGDPGSNIYKMNRSRGSRANYVDVFGGKTTNNPAVSAPTLFPSPAITSTPMNLFVPEQVETKENNPVDFLISGSATMETSEQVSGESSQTGNPDVGLQPQPAPGGPLMFNPNSFNQPSSAVKGTGTLGRKRYPH